MAQLRCDYNSRVHSHGIRGCVVTSSTEQSSRSSSLRRGGLAYTKLKLKPIPGGILWFSHFDRKLGFCWAVWWVWFRLLINHSQLTQFEHCIGCGACTIHIETIWQFIKFSSSGRRALDSYNLLLLLYYSNMFPDALTTYNNSNNSDKKRGYETALL